MDNSSPSSSSSSSAATAATAKCGKYKPGNEREQNFANWLRANHRGAWIQAFLAIQQENPQTLAWCDESDLVSIFISLPPRDESQALSDDELSSLFASFSM
jgi:hypothetical protein